MGIFVDYMYTFVRQYNNTNGIVSRKQISEWFRNKKAIRRSGTVEEYLDEKKSAIVVVGASCIGKSTYVREFTKQHPDYVSISYDEACYQKVDEVKAGSEESESRLIEILEEHILAVQDKNLIIDSMCLNPASRAALLNFLTDIGYEIHLIFYTQAYTEANMQRCIRCRAIEQVLYQDYLLHNNTRKMQMRDIMRIRNNIFEIYVKKKGISIEELKVQTSALPETSSHYLLLMKMCNDEIEENKVWWQEKRELFMLGADYYYEF